jgi:hypothetical protein
MHRLTAHEDRAAPTRRRPAGTRMPTTVDRRAGARTPAQVLAMQRMVGNAATTRMVETPVQCVSLGQRAMTGLKAARFGVMWGPRKISSMIAELRIKKERKDAFETAEQLEEAISNLPPAQQAQYSQQLHEAKVHAGMINI